MGVRFRADWEMMQRVTSKQEKFLWPVESALLVFLCATLALLCSLPEATANESVAKDARLGGDQQRTRFVTVLSKKVRFGIKTLADPYRVIIDLSDVKLDLPKGRGKEA